MADEITMTTVLQVNSDPLFSNDSKSVQADLASKVFSSGVQVIGPTHEVLEIRADQATPGVAFFQNLNDTLSIQLGTVTGGTFAGTINLLPGECATGRVATLSLYAKASASGGANLYYKIFST